MIKLGGLMGDSFKLGKMDVKFGQVVSNPFVNAFAPQIKEGEDSDYEVSMAAKQLDDIIKSATELKSKMGDTEFNVAAWIQDHISKSQDYINQANYGFDKNESVVNEAGVPKMYVKYMAVQKKVKELEEKQKSMAAKYFSEKELNKKSKMLQDLKKGTQQLASYRRNLASIEDKYLNNLYDDEDTQKAGRAAARDMNMSYGNPYNSDFD